MRPYDAARWLALATLLSLQFLFLRIAVPVLGIAPATAARVAFAALFLLPWAAYVARQPVALRERWKDYLTVGLVNNVLPFGCFSWGAAVLPAGYLAIINGLVPLWAALLAVPVFGERFGLRQGAGFALGLAGVALIVNLGPVTLDGRTLLGALAAIAGTAGWAWGGVLIKKRTARVAPVPLAAGSLSFAALLLAPLWALSPPPAAWTPAALGAVVAVGVFSSGLAYLAGFTLIRDIGPSRTLTVGLAIPVLGVLWGWLFLDEAVTASMLAGTALVLAALSLVLRK